MGGTTVPDDLDKPRRNSFEDMLGPFPSGGSPGRGEPGYSQDLRRDLNRAHDQHEAAAEAMAHASSNDTTTYTFLDYSGLGLILMPIEAVGHRWLLDEPISSHTLLAAGTAMAVGFIVLATSKIIKKMSGKPKGPLRLELDTLTQKAWVWFVVAAAIIFGIPLTVSYVSGPVRLSAVRELPSAPGLAPHSLTSDPWIEWNGGAGPVTFRTLYTHTGENLDVFLRYGMFVQSAPILGGFVNWERKRMKIDFKERFVRNEEMRVIIGVVTQVEGNQLVIQFGDGKYANLKVGITHGSYLCQIIFVSKDGTEDAYQFAIVSSRRVGANDAMSTIIIGPLTQENSQ